MLSASCRFVARVALVVAISAAGTRPAQAQSLCTNNFGGRTALPDLGTGLYGGFIGGLYPEGSNLRPAAHELAGLMMASEIRPLDRFGQLDTANGHIGFVSIGASTASQEFEVFEHAANVDVHRYPRVTTINGAQGGRSAFQWADPNHEAWTELARIVDAEGLTSAQVQVAWVKMFVRGSDVVGGWEPFPATATLLQTKLRAVVQILKARYPNVKLAYLSSRVYGGYADGTGFPEPIAYEEGFGVKWLIEEQINGDPALAFAGGAAAAPFLAWGPYLWADGVGSDGVPGGVAGRQDGMEYTCDDFAADGLHPSTAGRLKVANQLLQFVNTDTTSRVWYRNPNPPPTSGTPYYLDLDGIDDHLQAADADALTFAAARRDRPFTFEMWFRPDSMAGKQNLLGKWVDSGNQEYRLYLTGGFVRLDLHDTSTNATVSAYSNQSSLGGAWHHLAVTYDGRGGPAAAAGISFYVDGALVPASRNDAASYVAMNNTSASLQIGRESTSFRQYNGALDELRIWNVARSGSQIPAHTQSELAGTEPGLIAYWRMNEGIGATVADDSPSEHLATMFNNPTWVAGGPMEPPAADVTPPEISNIVERDLTHTGITISFDTNELTTGWVSYTTSTSCPCIDVFSPGAATSHTIRLSGLTPDTFYIHEVKATDGAGNFQVGPTRSFRTLMTPMDTTAPTVSLTSPASSTVSGTINVSAAASDEVGVAGVLFTVDGVAVGAEDVTSPYSVPWDTTAVPDGPHTIVARARDNANNISTVSRVVNVVNSVPEDAPSYLDFDGFDDHMSIADANSLSFTAGAADTPFTFEVWMRPDALTTKQNLLSKWSDGANQEYRLYLSSAFIRLDLRDSSTQAVVSVYSASSHSSLAGSWHHLAVTYDGRGGATAANGVHMYVDGVAIPVVRVTSSTYVAMENGIAALQVARESSQFRQFNGALDELRIWNVARTASELQLHLGSELTLPVAGLVGYWKMNEASGTAVTDHSEVGNSATVHNGPMWMSGGPWSP